MRILTDQIELKHANAYGILFDIQTALLNSGICEKGLDDIQCNAVAICVFEKDLEKGINTVSSELLVNTDAYGDKGQLNSRGLAEDLVSYVESIARQIDDLFTAAEKEDYEWTWKNIMARNVQHVSLLDYEKPLNAHFKECNFLGGQTDDGIFFCNDGKLVIMKKRKVNRLLLVRFE